MSKNTQVVTCFVLYENDKIVSQGSFQVLETTNTSVFASTDGREFVFSHLYEGAMCALEVRYLTNLGTECTHQLDIPVNRTKRKWKQTNLGETYEMYYRSQFETASAVREMTKKQKKLRYRGTRTIVQIYKSDESE